MIQRELFDAVSEFLEAYEGMEPADLFAKLPGSEAQRVVRARDVLNRAAQSPALAQGSLEKITSIVLTAIQASADPELYGAKYAKKLNEDRAGKAAERILALAAQPPAAPVETERKTFPIPPGHEAVRDSEGRATGEVRPRSSAGIGDDIELLKADIRDSRAINDALREEIERLEAMVRDWIGAAQLASERAIRAGAVLDEPQTVADTCPIAVNDPKFCSAGCCQRCSDFRDGWNARQGVLDRDLIAEAICEPSFRGHFHFSSQVKYEYRQMADRVIAALQGSAD